MYSTRTHCVDHLHQCGHEVLFGCFWSLIRIPTALLFLFIFWLYQLHYIYIYICNTNINWTETGKYILSFQSIMLSAFWLLPPNSYPKHILCSCFKAQRMNVSLLSLCDEMIGLTWMMKRVAVWASPAQIILHRDHIVSGTQLFLQTLWIAGEQLT